MQRPKSPALKNVCKLCALIFCVNAMQWFWHAPDFTFDQNLVVNAQTSEDACLQTKERVAKTTQMIAVLIKELGLLASLVQKHTASL